MGVLRVYHAEMGRLILEHEGTLERFASGGMMVFFNDPVIDAEDVGALTLKGLAWPGPCRSGASGA